MRNNTCNVSSAKPGAYEMLSNELLLLLFLLTVNIFISA